jgi:hypothetical protein
VLWAAGPRRNPSPIRPAPRPLPRQARAVRAFPRPLRYRAYPHTGTAPAPRAALDASPPTQETFIDRSNRLHPSRRRVRFRRHCRLHGGRSIHRIKDEGAVMITPFAAFMLIGASTPAFAMLTALAVAVYRTIFRARARGEGMERSRMVKPALPLLLASAHGAGRASQPRRLRFGGGERASRRCPLHENNMGHSLTPRACERRQRLFADMRPVLFSQRLTPPPGAPRLARFAEILLRCPEDRSARPGRGRSGET